MRSGFLALALVGLLVASAVPQGPAAPAGSLLAGAAKAEITPPVTTPMWGYTAREMLFAVADDVLNGPAGEVPRFVDQRVRGLDTEGYAKTFMASEGVHTRLYANAVVLDDGTQAMALVHVDLGGFPGEMHQAVADRLAEQGVPIPRENLLISATHTHGGPGGFFLVGTGYALLGGDLFDPRVAGLIADQVAKAVREAWEQREPATLAIGSADLTGASGNRATDAHLQGHAHDARHVKSLARILRVDALDGTPLGAVVNFAAHGTIVGHRELLLTGDNQGTAWRHLARGIAQASGQGEHDVVVAYLNGAQGDISPRGSGPDFFARVADAGARQAGPLLAAWNGLDGQGTSDVRLDSRFRFTCFCGQDVLPGEAISPVAILGQGEHMTLPPPLQIPGHGGKTPLLAGVGLVPQVVRLQVLRINDYVMAGMPGEASMALGEAIEQDIAALGAQPVDLVGLANDYISYMSTVPEYDWQSYEGSFNLYGRMTGPLFRQELVGMAKALLAGVPVEEAWNGLVEQPAIPLPTAPPLTLVPGAPPGAMEPPASNLSAGQLARFVWAGGSPAVDHPVDVPMVRIMDTATGAVVDDDLGFTVRLRYQKVGADLHRWTAEWPVPAGLAPGSYRFEVDGRFVDAPGEVAAYALASAAFQVG